MAERQTVLQSVALGGGFWVSGSPMGEQSNFTGVPVSTGGEKTDQRLLTSHRKSYNKQWTVAIWGYLASKHILNKACLNRFPLYAIIFIYL